MSDKNYSSGGVGFTSLLLIAFIVLKLCNVINWSWWWVLSPFWIPVGLLLIVLAFYLAFKIPEWRKSRNKAKRILEIMKDTGKNEWAATIQYNNENFITIPKSKWQERLEEMQARQKSEKK